MKVYDAATIRNVALVGHTGSGKTQLASAILADAGMINRFGKVDEGTTTTDFDEEEIARKHTLSASVAYAEWNKHKINLIDTPGIGSFLSDARAALQVADAALVVVDAVSGVSQPDESPDETGRQDDRLGFAQVGVFLRNYEGIRKHEDDDRGDTHPARREVQPADQFVSFLGECARWLQKQ